MKTIYAAIVFAFMATGIAYAQLSAAWQQCGGPTGAVVQSFFTAGNSLYASVNNTLYRHGSNGWERIGDAGSTNYFQFKNKLCGLGYNYRSASYQFAESADNGKSFDQYPLPSDLQNFNVKIVQAETKIYAIDPVHQNIYVSEDGKLWNKVGAIPSDILIFSGGVARGNILYATSGFNDGVWKSTDGGISFAKLNGLDAFSKPYIAYLGPYLIISNGKTILLSKDNGLTITEFNSPVTVSNLCWNGTNIIAKTSDNILRLKTDMNGKPTTWETLGSIDSLTSIIAMEDGRIYTTRNNKVSYTTNNGQNWNTAEFSIRAHTISAITSLGNSIVCSTSEGMYRSNDGGNTWIPYNWNILGYFLDPGLKEEERHANTYLSVAKFFSVKGNLVAFLKGSVEQDRRILYSSNAGETWLQVPNLFPYSLGQDTKDMVSTKNTVFVCAWYIHPIHGGGSRWSVGGIMRSDDGGKTWTYSDDGLPQIESISAPSSNLAATNNAVYVWTAEGMYRSTNEGHTWKQASDGLNLQADYPSLIIGHENTCYFVKGTSIYTLQDDATIWQKNGELPAGASSLMVFDGKLLAFGSLNGVQVVYERGQNVWNNVSEQYAFAQFITCLTKSGGTVYAGTSSASVWKNDGSNTTSVNEQRIANTCLLTTLPNPADATVTINLAQPTAGIVRCVVLDYAGRIMTEVEIPPASLSYSICTNAFAPGVYTYRLFAEAKLHTGMFAVVH